MRTTTTTRLAAYVAALVAILGIGGAVGATVGPDVTPAAVEAPPPVGEGVVATEDGYRFRPVSSGVDPGGGPFRFAITDQHDVAVRRFTPVHERDLHLIVVNRELTVFHHLHPTLAADGSWSIDLPALAGGSYRAVADFQVAGGPRLALGVDLAVAGPYTPGVLPEPRSETNVDGYDVTLATTVARGGTVTATLIVRRGGQPVTDLEPYLGARGHLVALRAGDLAYSHVHPVDDDHPAPGSVTFDASLPSAGRYGLFFDFKHDGVVHTASFTFDQGAVSGVARMEH